MVDEAEAAEAAVTQRGEKTKPNRKHRRRAPPARRPRLKARAKAGPLVVGPRPKRGP
jgi:hypothetical protein